jgi:hypothetical protein
MCATTIGAESLIEVSSNDASSNDASSNDASPCWKNCDEQKHCEKNFRLDISAAAACQQGEQMSFF